MSDMLHNSGGEFSFDHIRTSRENPSPNYIIILPESRYEYIESKLDSISLSNMLHNSGGEFSFDHIRTPRENPSPNHIVI